MFLVVLLLSALFLSGCSSDSPTPFKPTLPGTNASPIVAIKHQGSLVSCYDWELSYSGGRLYTATGLLRDADSSLDRTYSYKSTLSYGETGVSVSTTSGEDISLSLNAEGYVSRMTVNRNVYTFSYTGGYLTAWTKTAFENSFGQVVRYDSSAKITYEDGDIKSVVFTDASRKEQTLTFTPSETLNADGLLPECASQQLGLIGFEHLFYAGLFGKASKHLVSAIRFYSDDDDYTLSFEYGLQGGHVVLCNFHTPTGGVASVNYAY